MTSRFTREREFVRWNEAMTRKYDSEAFHLRSSFAVRWVERLRVASVLDLLGSTDQDLVLEVGCGAGLVLEQIPARWRLGVDLSRFVLMKARSRLKDRNTDLVQANGERLPFASGSVGKIVCTEVIEHTPAPRRLARELARVAVEDATIIITIPNERLIDVIKALVQRLGLARWLLEGRDGTGSAYDASPRGNEWHLHRFSRSLLDEVTRDHLVLETVKAIPNRILPLRYVARFRVRLQADPEAKQAGQEDDA